MYLLDTNVVSELRKARSGNADKQVTAWAEQVPAGDLYLSAVSVLELEIGVLRNDPIRCARPRSRLTAVPISGRQARANCRLYCQRARSACAARSGAYRARNAHWLEYMDWAQDLLQDPMLPDAGLALPREAPGDGMEWNEKAVAACIVD